jgi:ribosomal protein S18 acetylase RimI-like enzyme
MAEIRMRIAADADRARLIPMINAAFSIEEFLDGTRTDEERLAVAMEKGSILMAEDRDGKLLGSIYMESRGKQGYLGMLAVDPAEQGRGLARMLVEEAERRFRNEGCEEIEIIVLNLRRELPAIYHRFGFVEAGVTEFKPSRTLRPGIECHGIVMIKKL